MKSAPDEDEILKASCRMFCRPPPPVWDFALIGDFSTSDLAEVTHQTVNFLFNIIVIFGLFLFYFFLMAVTFKY